MAEAPTKPSVGDIWRWLEDAPDPEIPVLSVVDLGIVRAVEWRGETLIVTVTPTYSACPATSVIALDVEAMLRRRGIADVKIETRLVPPWTTDWISEKGREKLRAYGIAPPEGAVCAGAAKAAGARIACPRCGSTNTEEISRFGSTPCKASWRCKDCLEPFDYFKSF
ncbi:1,2-phenylacetyl-CoA epoxidase subunit PaaD [Amphiplicatus metriothermophilus]|uniref:Ring-1,2-phenylacetyl-CoA epoxidase subunit PaaD n=1 Tax=Amphiplicatus metriothermophilus TaxID=1519374 RepID=A0A239PVU4_9PROT|nr:1,2-phenylacetyl-CoA epoxidase subunit PaaD [Amphiplicatus metriothermophilus]MBB5519665.1 ring-1,2-phenylacetyl-CoA epoxidase subunit PaaD [Amphiplicatus metriothermophilus]SNT74228.1 ring-1,2-phenylacetyl-CoA epoxidase subunit PaaD [Amphiplicatus metriothermophilus]